MIIENKLKDYYSMILLLFFAIICGFAERPMFHLLLFSALVIILVFYFIRKKEDKIINLSVGVIPCLGLLKLNSIPLHNIFYVVCLITFICCNRRLYISKKSLLLYFIFISFDIIKYFFFLGDFQFNLFNLLNLFVLYLVFLYGINIFYYIKNNPNHYMIVIRHFILGVAASIIYGYLYRYINYGLGNTFLSSNVGLRNSGASLDPNYFSFYIVLSISFIIILYLYANKRNIKYLFLALLYVFAGFSSISRMYLVLCIPIMVVFIVICFKTIFTKYAYQIFFISIFVIIIMLFNRATIVNSFDMVISRFNVDSSVDVTNGRIDLLNMYVNTMKSNPEMIPFGVGISNYYKRLNIPLYAHNLYIELFVCLGLFGILLLFCLFLYLIFKSNILYNSIRFLPLLVSSIAGLAISFIDVEGFYIVFSLIFITIFVLTPKIVNGGEI